MASKGRREAKNFSCHGIAEAPADLDTFKLPAVSNVEKIIEENKRIIRADILRRLEQTQQFIPQVAHLLPYNPNPTTLDVLEQQHKFLLLQQQLLAQQILN